MSKSKVSAETLTDDERRELTRGVPAYAERAKALSIIDQLTAALEAERAKREHSASDWKVQVEAAESRAEALQARVAELEAELRHAEESERHVRESLRAAYEKNERLTECLPGGPKSPELAPELAAAAESELATAKARVAELEAERKAANTLLEQVLKCSDPEEELPFEGIQNHLSGQEPTTRAAESELADLRGRVKRAEEWPTSAWISNAKRVSLAWEALRGR